MKIERIQYSPIQPALSAERIEKDFKGTLTTDAVTFEHGSDNNQQRHKPEENEQESNHTNPDESDAHDNALPRKPGGMNVVA